MEHRKRHIPLLLVIAGSLAVVLLFPPVLQDPAYHAFADQRVFFGISRFLDIFTNLPFLVIGIAGLLLGFRRGISGAWRSWMVFFAGVALVGIGSAYYHADPSDQRLVWDRLPMTAGFMGVLVAVLTERISERIETYGLLPAVLAGMLSVLWWSWNGDLRPYIPVQALPLTVIPLMLLLYPDEKTGDRFFMLSLLCHMLAKAAEHFDQAFYIVTGQVISGHSFKHLAAKTSCAILLVLLKRRERSIPGKRADQQRARDAEAVNMYTTSVRGMR
jgi:hypothetical protein